MINITIPKTDGTVSLMRRTIVENKNKTKSIKELSKIPNKAGLYLLYDKQDVLLYIGKAKHIKARIKQHLDTKTDNFYNYSHNVFKIEYIIVESAMKRDIYETYAINTLKPKLNTEKLFEFTNTDYDKYKCSRAIKQEKQREKEFQDRYDETIKDFYL